MVGCGDLLNRCFHRGPVKAPGPRPMPDRQCLQGILYVLHIGNGWEGLPQELGFRSGMTCLRRIKRWINAGLSTICFGSCLPS
ncbi:transposase [Streptomyces sp. FR-108]|uniref:transposase n=1 Tax=Streptomyces sp. FR-108 TaxID=3416665 RepID=UPI003CEB19C1